MIIPPESLNPGYIYPASPYECESGNDFRNTTSDLAAIRSSFQACIQASERLGNDAAKRPQWQKVLDHLADYPLMKLADGTEAGASALDKDGKPTDAQGYGFCCSTASVFPTGTLGIKDQGSRLYNPAAVRVRRHPEFSYAISPVAVVAARLGMADEALKHLSFSIRQLQQFPQGLFTQRSLVKDTPMAVDRRIMETNYFSTVALTKAVLPSMLASRSGDIVVVSSLVGHFSTPLRSAYAASKHALHGFFDALRAEVYADGLNVMLVCPGFIRTEISLHALTADGSPQASMDDGQAAGLAPDQCAAQILDGLDGRKDEIVIGGRETRYLLLHRFFPALFRRAMRTFKVT